MNKNSVLATAHVSRLHFILIYYLFYRPLHCQPALIYMDARRQGQRRALAPHPPGKVVKCICIIFETFIGFWGLRRHRGFVYGPRWRTEAPDPVICLLLEKNPAGAHALNIHPM